MDILQENLRIQKENYKELMKEYEEEYPKYKEEEQKKDFFERLKHTRDDMAKQLEVINTDIDMLEHRRHQRDFRNQARLLEARLDELNIMVKDFQFSDNNFNYKLLDQVIKGKEAINGIDFDGKTTDELGQDKTVKNHKAAQIREVDNYYDDAIRRLDGIQGNIKGANTQLKELSKQIRAQNIKLLEMDDLIRETQSVLARMTQLVEFFNKVFLKDKCMNLIILLMILLCIGCVVLIIMEKSKSGAPVEETPAADATDTTTAAARILANYVLGTISQPK
jgi:predicted  nucleic acid-binding Zn-ribbon protein